MIVPVYCLESFSKLTQERETQTESEMYLSSGFRRPHHLQTTGKSPAEEGADQRASSENLQRVPFKSLAEYWSGVWMTYQDWGKDNGKGAGGTVSKAYRRTEDRLNFPEPERRNFAIYYFAIYRTVLPHKWDRIISSLSKGCQSTYPGIKASLERIKLFLRNLMASQNKSQKQLKGYQKK